MKRIELSEEELFELTNQIALVEYIRSKDEYKQLYSKDDMTQDVLFHFYKNGLKGLEDKSIEHIKNIIYLQCRNTVFTKTKNLSSKFQVINKSLDENVMENKALLDTIPVEDVYNRLELDDLNNLLLKLDNKELKNYLIKYNNKYYTCSYRNIAIIFYIVYKDKKVSTRDVEDYILDSEGNRLCFSRLHKLLSLFKTRARYSFGGELV